VGLKLFRQEKAVEERYPGLFGLWSDDADIERRDERLEAFIASNQSWLADDVSCLRNVRECDDKVTRADFLIRFVFACEWLESISPVSAAAKERLERD
jgi:hypothetical protein